MLIRLFALVQLTGGGTGSSAAPSSSPSYVPFNGSANRGLAGISTISALLLVVAGVAALL